MKMKNLNLKFNKHIVLTYLTKLNVLKCIYAFFITISLLLNVSCIYVELYKYLIILHLSLAIFLILFIRPKTIGVLSSYIKNITIINTVKMVIIILSSRFLVNWSIEFLTLNKVNIVILLILCLLIILHILIYIIIDEKRVNATTIFRKIKKNYLDFLCVFIINRLYIYFVITIFMYLLLILNIEIVNNYILALNTDRFILSIFAHTFIYDMLIFIWGNSGSSSNIGGNSGQGSSSTGGGPNPGGSGPNPGGGGPNPDNSIINSHEPDREKKGDSLIRRTKEFERFLMETQNTTFISPLTLIYEMSNPDKIEGFNMWKSNRPSFSDSFFSPISKYFPIPRDSSDAQNIGSYNPNLLPREQLFHKEKSHLLKGEGNLSIGFLSWKSYYYEKSGLDVLKKNFPNADLTLLELFEKNNTPRGTIARTWPDTRGLYVSDFNKGLVQLTVENYKIGINQGPIFILRYEGNQRVYCITKYSSGICGQIKSN